MRAFKFDEFCNPTNEFYPVYGWVWNDKITREGIKNQIDEMYSQNILGVYVIPISKEFRPHTMVTNLQPDYLSDEYFELLAYAVDYAYEKGMKFWLYDEAGWPSGNANFLVTASDPSLCLEVACDPAVRNEDGPRMLRNYSDLTNIKATEKFVELTHEAHKGKMGESFKKLAPFVFTDEPSIRPAPYSKAIREIFKQRTGEELSREKIIAHNDPEYNIAYHDACADAFAENYFKPIRKWCHENGMLHLGHLDSEHEAMAYNNGGHHHPMRLLRLLDVPGVDTIWGQIDMDGHSGFGFFPRLASSAAEQNGSGLSMTESMSVYGTSPYERFRYVVGYQTVRGINIINPLLLMYDNSGYYSIRQRPSYNQPQPGIEYLAEFNKYLAGLTYLMQCGKPDTSCALYLPMRDLWATDESTHAAVRAYMEIGERIERNHGQFDIVDDDVISECDIEALKQGRIEIGRACYTRLYIPADKYMPENVKSRLELFTRGGGEILRSDNICYFPMLDIAGDDNKLRVHKRICENCEIYLVFNEAGERVTASIDLPEGSCEIRTTGERYAITKEYTFESGETKIFITGNTDEVSPQNVVGNKLLQIDKFEMQPLRRFKVTGEGAAYELVSAEKMTLSCGDWAESIGAKFSGECEYKTTFKLNSNDCDIVLSLGDVKHNCEVFVNGIAIGIAFMPPYRFVIDKKLLKKENELVIKVSNTAANAFVHLDLPEEWEQKQIGPYHEKATLCEKKFVCGGLIGPVVLFEKG